MRTPSRHRVLLVGSRLPARMIPAPYLRAAALLALAGCTPDRSHGSKGGGGGGETGGGVTEDVASRTTPWQRDETAAPGSIAFTELLYHPASADEAEWIELHNPMALDMDLSGWSLAEGVAYTFPEGTVLGAG